MLSKEVVEQLLEYYLTLLNCPINDTRNEINLWVMRKTTAAAYMVVLELEPKQNFLDLQPKLIPEVPFYENPSLN